MSKVEDLSSSEYNKLWFSHLVKLASILTRRSCNPRKGIAQNYWLRFEICLTSFFRPHTGLYVLQPLWWCCVDCVIHHERDVREEQHHTYMWREQAIIEWSWHMNSIVACCRSAKLCAHAARDFRSQHMITPHNRFCDACEASKRWFSEPNAQKVGERLMQQLRCWKKTQVPSCSHLYIPPLRTSVLLVFTA